MTTPIRVLILEDNEMDAELILSELHQGPAGALEQKVMI